jgi:hypothetical protein
MLSLPDYYVIYHVPGVKCGCTIDFPNRCHQQGLTDGEFEILDLVSKSCGSKFAGDVEWAWSKWFGYQRGWHYSGSYALFSNEDRSYAGKIGGTKTGRLKKSGWQSGKAGKIGGKVAMAVQLANGIHSSQTGKGPFHTGVAGKASAKGPNAPWKNGRAGFQTGAAGKVGGKRSSMSLRSINKREFECPSCHYVGRGPTMFRYHFDRCSAC